jgi:hypothetical protein
MAIDLYLHDIATWSEQQSDLLRRLARGERVNGVDWENVAEEIESVGRSEVKAVESLLGVALLHVVKLLQWPEHPAGMAWRSEVANLLLQGRRRYEPSMARRIDAAEIMQDALQGAAKLEMPGFEKMVVSIIGTPSIAQLVSNETGVEDLSAFFDAR